MELFKLCRWNHVISFSANIAMLSHNNNNLKLLCLNHYIKYAGLTDGQSARKSLSSVADVLICSDNYHIEISVSAVNMELYNKMQLTYE